VGSGVFRTTDGGDTWKAWGEGLPPTLVYSVAEARDNSGRVFVGTETAVYQRGMDDAEWVDVTAADAPVTIYWSAEVLSHENTIRFGTYGRGIWDLQLGTDDVACYPIHDEDGDGSWCDADCDDTDPLRFPGAVDLCEDGLDEDCDGVDATCPDECGCVAGASGGAVWWLLPLLVLRRRRAQSAG
jgi:hypothetical protein